jgi:hypothetical protein
MSYLEKF